MFGKKLRLATMVLFAAGTPVVWFNDTWYGQMQQIQSWLKSKRSGAPATRPSAFTAMTEEERQRLESGTAPASRESESLSVLEEVLRFDVDVRWITQRWPRVSIIRATPGFEGYRVPLVTGTRLTDLAGSLTYYFDDQRRVRRIAFTGTTGDERELVQFLAGRGLRTEATIGSQLYVSRWNGQVRSALRIAPASVVRANAPHTRFNIMFELNLPERGFQLSREFQQRIAADRQAG